MSYCCEKIDFQLQVAPTEIEELLLTHNAVLDTAVIGVPNERYGEVPRAYVVLRPQTECKEKYIYNFVEGMIMIR